MNYQDLKYTVENQHGVSYKDALILWKTMYKDFNTFMTNVIRFDSMQEFGDHCASVWNEIKPATAQDGFAQENLEIRRLYFRAIGIEKMFQELDPALVAEETIVFNNAVWNDSDNSMDVKIIHDKYELYLIKGDKLFPEEKSDWRRANADIYAVRCWCTTTGREYWIYVPRHVGEKKDAIEAIAWTFQLNISEPEALYRQGDIIIAKASADSRELSRPYHIEKDMYLKLLKSQS
jgi:hypothetical protein